MTTEASKPALVRMLLHYFCSRKKARRKKDPITKKKAVDKGQAQAQKQLADALIAFHQAQSEKENSNRKSAAPRRERDLLEVFSEHKG